MRWGSGVIGVLVAACWVATDAFVTPQGLRHGRPSRAASRRGERSLSLQLEWERVNVLDVKPAAEGLVHVTIDAGDVMGGYNMPGQYVQLKPHSPGAKAGFFAIANAPDKSGKGVAEFLIKRTEGSAWICDAKQGDVVDMSAPQGKGFQVQNFGEQGVNMVVMCAAGSGIAPIRAAIESEELGLSELSRRGRLYFGVKTPQHLPYQDRFPAWRERGVQVIPIFSRAPVPPSNQGAYNGYIQQVVEGHELSAPEKTAALLCGMKEMTILTTNILKEKGVDGSRILLNF